MHTIKGWGCVLATATFAICTQARPQDASSQRVVRTKAAAVHSAPAAIHPAPAESARAGDDTAATKLPVRRVILYKTGVGYFEHLGRVEGDQSVRVDFTSGQLNDVLQSLTILDLNGGRIAGVNYNSEAPLSQRMGTLRLPLEETTDVSKFYAALRGARLEVRSGTNSVTGRLLSVERKTRVSGGTTLEVDLATLVSDTGEVRSIELTPAVSVRLAEADVSGEVSRYLGLLSSVRQQDIRRMTIDTAGTGERQLYVSYISEVPVWKTTYRIVLPSKAGDQPLLQGWAIVDNTVGEDWSNVELSLVAGAPQSFIQQLSQPYYARRPVIALPVTAQLSPQTHEGAMLGGIGGISGVVTDQSGGVIANAQIRVFGEDGSVVSQSSTDGLGKYQIDLPAGNYHVSFSSPGFKTTSVQGLSLGGGRGVAQNVMLQVGGSTQSVMVQASANSVQTESSEISAVAGGHAGSGNELGNVVTAQQLSALPNKGRNYTSIAMLAPGVLSGVANNVPGAGLLNAARGGMESAASGADLGDLFEYKLKDRVTIRKNESALVPIVQAHVEAEKVSLWSSGLGSSRPLRALWLTNSSPLTLDGGSFSVLEGEAFAGEGLTDPIKPGEKRLLSYAADLGVRVDAKSASNPQHVTMVRIAHGVMIQTCELREETTYTVRNDDTAPRTVLIEHPRRADWLIAPEVSDPDETTMDAYRFRLPVGAKATSTLAVREFKPLNSNYQISDIDENQLKLFVQQKSINPEIEAAFRKIIEQKNQISALEDEISKRDDETKKIYDDQQRLRENLKALKGSAEERALTQRYTQQLNDQETRLETLQKESADLQTKHDQAQEALDKMVEDPTLNVAI
jgi:hypothetical protein